MSALRDLPFEEIEDMMRFLAAWHGCGLQHLKGPRRYHEYVLARRCCYRLLRARGWSYQRIADYFHKSLSGVVDALRPRASRVAHQMRRAA